MHRITGEIGALSALALAILFSLPAEALQPFPDEHPCANLPSGFVKGYPIYPHAFPGTAPSYFRCDLGMRGGETGNKADCVLSPYSYPLDYVGRFVDISLQATAIEAGFPGATGYNALYAEGSYAFPALNRIYLFLGAGINAFDLPEFVTQVDTTKMAGRAGAGNNKCYYFRGWHPTAFYLNTGSLHYPEQGCRGTAFMGDYPLRFRCASGWSLRLNHDHGIRPGPDGFDVDEERRILTRSYGPGVTGPDLGILRDDPATGKLTLIKQVNDQIWERIHGGDEDTSDAISAHGSLIVRSGERSYVLVGADRTRITVLDITDPKRPITIGDFRNWDYDRPGDQNFMIPARIGSSENAAKIRFRSGHVVAILSVPYAGTPNSVNLYTAEELVKAGAPDRTPVAFKKFPAETGYQYTAIATDGIRFYALMARAKKTSSQGAVTVPLTKISVIEPATPGNPATFAKTKDHLLEGAFAPLENGRLTYGAGYLTVAGRNFPHMPLTCDHISNCGIMAGHEQVRIYRRDPGQLVRVSVGDHLTRHYSPSEFVPEEARNVGYGKYTEPRNTLIFSTQNQKYIAHSARTVGDVYRFSPDTQPWQPPAGCVEPDSDNAPPVCDLSNVPVWTNEKSVPFNCYDEKPAGTINSGGLAEIKCRHRARGSTAWSEWKSCTSQRSHGMSDLQEGEGNLIEVYAVDHAGNRSQTVQMDFGYDSIAPRLTGCAYNCTTGKFYMQKAADPPNSAPTKSKAYVQRLYPDNDEESRTGCQDYWREIFPANYPGRFQITCKIADEAGNVGSEIVIPSYDGSRTEGGNYSCP